MPPKRRNRQSRKSNVNSRKKGYRTPSPPPRTAIEPLTPTYLQQYEGRLTHSDSYFTFARGGTPSPASNDQIIPRPTSNESHSDSTLSILSSVSPPPRSLQPQAQSQHNTQQQSSSSYDSSPFFNGVRYDNQLSFFADLAMTYADPTMATKLQELARKEAAERTSVTPGPSINLRTVQGTPSKMQTSPPTDFLQTESRDTQLIHGLTPPSSSTSILDNPEASSSDALHGNGKIPLKGTRHSILPSSPSAVLPTHTITSEDNTFPIPPAKRNKTDTRTVTDTIAAAELLAIELSSESMLNESATSTPRPRRGGRKASGKTRSSRGKEVVESQSTPKPSKPTRGRSSKKSFFIPPTSRVLRSSLGVQSLVDLDATFVKQGPNVTDANKDSKLHHIPVSGRNKTNRTNQASTTRLSTAAAQSDVRESESNAGKANFTNGTATGQTNTTDDKDFDTHVEQQLKSHLALTISDDHDEDLDEPLTPVPSTPELMAEDEILPITSAIEKLEKSLIDPKVVPENPAAEVPSSGITSTILELEKQNESEIRPQLPAEQKVSSDESVTKDATPPAGESEDGIVESMDAVDEAVQPVACQDASQDDAEPVSPMREMPLETEKAVADDDENMTDDNPIIDFAVDTKDAAPNVDLPPESADKDEGAPIAHGEAEDGRILENEENPPMAIPAVEAKDTTQGDDHAIEVEAVVPNDSIAIQREEDMATEPQSPLVPLPLDSSAVSIISLADDETTAEELDIFSTEQNANDAKIASPSSATDETTVLDGEAAESVPDVSTDAKESAIIASITAETEMEIPIATPEVVADIINTAGKEAEPLTFNERETIDAVSKSTPAAVYSDEISEFGPQENSKQATEESKDDSYTAESAQLGHEEAKPLDGESDTLHIQNCDSMVVALELESGVDEATVDIAVNTGITYDESTDKPADSESASGGSSGIAQDNALSSQITAQSSQLPQQTDESVIAKMSPDIGGIAKDTDVEVVEFDTAQLGAPEAANEPSNLGALVATANSGDLCSICKSATFVGNESNTISAAPAWIQCDGCKEWCHTGCAKLTDEDIASIDKYHCALCEPTRGPSTPVRKSTRSKVPIDYEALNDGSSVPAQSATNKIYHHYVDKIVNNEFPVEKEYFPRVVPHELNLNFFEDGSGFTTPIVIPAHTNPYPKKRSPAFRPYHQGFSTNFRNEAPSEDEWDTTDDEDEDSADDDTDAMGMGFPQDLSVRKVVELVGLDETVEVIDVKSQQGDSRKWPLSKWLEYFEEPNKTRIYNVISLEVSQSKLGKLIRRPKVVREMDISDQVWPKSRMKEFPNVQYYVLMSVANAYTDWHIDFGGSSVYYRILKGRKTFYFMRPTQDNFDAYTKWANLGQAQNWTWLAEGRQCFRVDLGPGDTMLIPSGWIHAVYTPEDSLVIGGNFLTRLHYKTQFKVHEIERLTHTPQKYRFPRFAKLHWFEAEFLMQEDPMPEHAERHLLAGKAANFRASKPKGRLGNLSDYVLEGLPDFALFLRRNSLIAQGIITEGLTKQKADAVRAAIPKHRGDGWELAQRFARWVTWKRNCGEVIPPWAYPDADPAEGVPNPGVKKLSVATIKHMERAKADQERRAQGMIRQGLRNHSFTHQASPAISATGSEVFEKVTRLTPRQNLVHKQKTPTARKRKRDSERASYDPEKLEKALRMALTGYEDSREEIRRAIAAEVRSQYENVNVRRIGPARSVCKPCRDSKTKCLHKDDIRDLSAKVLEVYGSFLKEEGLPSAKRNRTPLPLGVDNQDGLDDDENEGEGTLAAAQEDNSKGKSNDRPHVTLASVPKIPRGVKKPAVKGLIGRKKADAVLNGEVPKRRGGKRRACDTCRQLRRKCTHNPLGLPIDQLQKLLNSQNAEKLSENLMTTHSSSENTADIDHEEELDEPSDEESNQCEKDEDDGDMSAIPALALSDDNQDTSEESFENSAVSVTQSSLEKQLADDVPNEPHRDNSNTFTDSPSTVDNQEMQAHDADNTVTSPPFAVETTDDTSSNTVANDLESEVDIGVVLKRNSEEDQEIPEKIEDFPTQLLTRDGTPTTTNSDSVSASLRKRKASPATDLDASPKRLQYSSRSESPQFDIDIITASGRSAARLKVTPRKQRPTTFNRQISDSPNNEMLNSAPWQAIKAQEFGLRNRSKSKS